MNTEWNSTTKHIVGVGLFIFGVYLIYLSRSVLTLVIIAALIAFLLMPIVDLLHHRYKMPRIVAVLLTYIITSIVVALAPLILFPQIIRGFNFLARVDYTVVFDNSLRWFNDTLISLRGVDFHFGEVSLNFDRIVDPLLDSLQNAERTVDFSMPSAQTIINSLNSAVTLTYGVAANLVGTVFSAFLAFIVVIISAIYFSLDAHRFKGQFLGIIPEKYRFEAAILLDRLKKIWQAYFRGRLILMIIVGVGTWAGTSLLGVPGAFALGVIAGALELIPNLGPFIATIPGVLVALIQGSTTLDVNNFVFALIVTAFYFSLQQFENAVIIPRVIGDAVDLHPIVILVGVIVGANVAGVIGALVAAPVIASGREIIRYLYYKVLGEDPFPPQPQEIEATEQSWYKRTRLVVIKLQSLLTQPPQQPGPTDPPPSPPSSDEL
ncbi:MAG: AI-2E family transporter [Anaerolineae bacterium]|nr:AI-2E family transporter [Anaerolineae bacterium]MCB0222527.1 AI-2E family transporter [Anaerolineae bacterium]MCB9105252.1 AI-2E family transporter [Anaerolineales bacterium]